MASAAELAMLLTLKNEASPGFAKAEQDVSSFGSKVSSVGGMVATAVGGAALAGIAAIGTAFTIGAQGAAEMESVTAKLQGQLGLTADQAAEMGDVVEGVFRANFGESRDAVAAAVVAIQQNIGQLPPHATHAAAESALALQSLFEAPVAESTRAVGVMMKNFQGLSETQAFDLIAAGFQRGGNYSDELLDTMREYSPQFAAMGLSAEQMTGILIAGAQAGAFNLDKVGDAVKEFNIRAQDGSKGTAEGFKAIGLDADKMGASIAKGGPAAQQAFQATLAALATIEDPLKRNTAGVQLFGTQWEDLGPTVVMAMAEGVKGVEGYEGAAARAAATTGQGFSASVEQLRRTINGLLTDAVMPLMPHLTTLINSFSAWLPEAFAVARDAARQMTDAFYTVQQVFDNDWEASDEIEGLALAAGNAAVTVRDLSRWLGSVGDAANDMGAMDNFVSALMTINTEGELAQSSLGKIVEQLRQLTGAAAGSSEGIQAVALVVRVVANAFELWAVSMGQAIDTVLSLTSGALSFLSVMGNMGRAMVALATGDVAGYDSAMQTAAASMVDLITTHAQFTDRTVERARQGFQSIAGYGEAGMADTTAAVKTGMVASSAAVEAQVPVMTAAAEAMGTGMSGALEAAAPAMAAAAESGASQAVAAVEGQAGAASGAGRSVGDNLGAGMQTGIMGWVGRVAAAARELVSSAIGAAESEGDIRSPSGKTEYLGQMLDEGLIKGIEGSSPAVRDAMRSVIQSVTDYAPIAQEIARVEREINDVRSRGQTDALFRAQDMITVESELLRLKRDLTEEERKLLPIRNQAADAERQVQMITSGSLSDRSTLLENDAQRKQLRLETLDLEKQLVGLDRDSKRAVGIQAQIDKLRDQDRLLGIEADRIRLTNDIAATAERRRVLGLNEILTSQQQNTDAINRQIGVLGAEAAVFQANEAIIKNATDNEVSYRQRLIAVFNAENQSNAARLTAGRALLEQLRNEGKISDELYNAVKKVTDQTQDASAATRGLGSAAKGTAEDVLGLVRSLGKLPDWFTPKGANSSGGGGSSGGVLFRPSSADSVLSGVSGSGMGGGGRQDTLTIDLRTSDEEAMRLYVTGKELAYRLGRDN